MPNWCSNSITFFGNKKTGDMGEALSLFWDIKTIAEGQERVQTDFGKLWLGNVVDYFGANIGMNHDNTSCRGWIEDFNWDEGKPGVLTMEFETAWAPLLDFADCILQRYPHLEYVYTSVEPGCCLYINTDKTGEFYPYKFVLYLDMALDDDEALSKYGIPSNIDEVFKNKEDFLSYVNKVFNKEFKTLPEFDKFAVNFRKKNDKDIGWFDWYYYMSDDEPDPFKEEE